MHKRDTPVTCRYCGHTAPRRTMQAEQTLSHRFVYSCKDLETCGARLRAQRAPLPDDGQPF